MTDSTMAGRLLAGRYRLARPLGRGGMGVVWQARDELLGRLVAVKEVLLPPELPDEEREVLRRRTLREARSAARLSHPNVVTVFDVVEEDGRPWIVMELVRSTTLAHAIREYGPLPPREVARIGLQVLAALHAAHRAGVLHRDVKPSNVLLTGDGRVVLTDFGIATLEGDPSLTMSGTLLGSPAFIAPERVQGRGLVRSRTCGRWARRSTPQWKADRRTTGEPRFLRWRPLSPRSPTRRGWRGRSGRRSKVCCARTRRTASTSGRRDICSNRRRQRRRLRPVRREPRLSTRRRSTVVRGHGCCPFRRSLRGRLRMPVVSQQETVRRWRPRPVSPRQPAVRSPNPIRPRRNGGSRPTETVRRLSVRCWPVYWSRSP